MKIKTRPDAIAKLMTKSAAGLPEAVKVFAQAFEASPADRPALAKRLHEIEEAADEHHRDFVAKVGDTFITPFDREDLASMAQVLDDVIDMLDHAVDLLVRFEVGQLPKAFIENAHDLIEMSQLARDGVELIKKPKKLRALWLQLTEYENNMDRRYHEILTDILNGDLDVFLAIKLKILADTTERVADHLEGFVRALAVAAIKET